MLEEMILNIFPQVFETEIYLSWFDNTHIYIYQNITQHPINMYVYVT